MPFTKLLQFIAVLSVAALMCACKGSAGSPQEAAEILQSVKTWQIEEIAVNDAVTFKDGKMQQQFGGIDFQRYMETVQFKNDGVFSGVFKGESEPFLLQWKTDDKGVSVNAPNAAAGSGWTIQSQDVRKTSFTMKTQSTAYDYPRVTRIALKFKASQ